jgi:hypothetical protein
MASEEARATASVTPRSSTRSHNNNVAKVSAKSSSSSSTTTTPKQQERAKLNCDRLALWAASLEMWCHQILAVRQVYPKETFCSVEFLSATAHFQANRHPGVISYIAEAIQVAVPALLVDGVANELSLVILHHHQDRNNNNNSNNIQLEPPRQVEKYTLNFSESTARHVPRESSSAASSIKKTNLCLEDLEREMLDLVLSVHTLGQKTTTAIGSTTKANNHNDNTTFKIMLHIPTSKNHQEHPPRAMSGSELNKALSDGRWYFPSVATRQQQQQPEQHDDHPPPERAKERHRPIHDMNLPTGRVHFSMSCFPSEQTKKSPRAKHKVSFAEKMPLLEEKLD